MTDGANGPGPTRVSRVGPFDALLLYITAGGCACAEARMGVYELLELWWVVPAGLALLGYGLALAGLSPVTVAFQDPATGREFVLPNAGKHGDRMWEAWVGREVEVRYPRGRPDRFRLVLATPDEKNGRVVPDCSVATLLLGLAIHATVVGGLPWALLGFGSLVTVTAALSPDIRMARASDALLASAVAVPARVVAVAKDVCTDGEGDEIVNHTPVLTFTTHEGVHVTVLVGEGIPEPALSLGRDLTLHYTPSDLTVHTLDLAAEHRANEKAVGTVIFLLIAGTVAVVTGAVLL